jgi:hypothetical protein
VAGRSSGWAGRPLWPHLATVLVTFLCAGGAQALDPRCGDRTATGQIVCIIDQPNVTQHETIYPSVQFAPNDKVDVLADGCVQTGGLGNTWKRYVNPIGEGDDHLYHGMIRIPTASPFGDGLNPIQGAIGKRQTVIGAGVPVSQLVLHLGYQDDDYSDNGYYSHDDGVNDQCKNDQGHGGPARVIITIYRGVTAPPSQSRFDFDVLSDTMDVNLLPYNPQWSWQRSIGNQGRTPDTSMCHNFSKTGSVFGIPSPVAEPNFPDCTDQADASSVDLPTGINQDICNTGGIFKSDSFAGHVNWFPVTLEGHADWGDESTDDDNTFTFTSDLAGNPLSVNSRPGLHIEFDSDETTKRFGTDEWHDFHAAVQNDNHDLAVHYFSGHTILTGMFGLDGEHNLKAELHPLFALATKRDNFGNDATHEDWLMFVRNRGDEGFCSSQLWDSGFEDYTFRLPWLAGMQSVDVDWVGTQFEGTDGTSGPLVTKVPPPSTPSRPSGVYVAFHLGPASNTPFIDGSLKLVWTPGSGPINPGSGPINKVQGLANNVGKLPAHIEAHVFAPPEDETDEVEHRIDAAQAPLPAAQRAAVRGARNVAAVSPVLHRLPPSGAVLTRVSLPTPRARGGRIRLHAISAGPAAVKLQRDAAQVKALCAATQNAPAGLPKTACGVVVRDHR